ncbi:MAG: DUF4981 domain-containing protein [Oscillospiraceae bacterium]|nr:DUF4981 domain-containing protein [Oscillospiraceae bacterium]
MKKTKRILSLMLSCTMLAAAVPMSELSVSAATSSVGLKSAVTANVNAKKFTHKEWTGKDYTDLSGRAVTGEDVFGINREDASLTLIPYQSTAAAAAAVWDYNAREKSTYMQMLTGEDEDWQLAVFQNEGKAQPAINAGFMNSNYTPNGADGWKNVQLPKSWTCQGFDFPIYANVVMPWQSGYDYVTVPDSPVNYNPVGLYRKTFTLDDGMLDDGRRVIIHFEGVESAYYVYVNGKEVGYSEDTFSPHRFDITDYLTSGENTLAVKVHKFCDGTWFEGQDMIYDGGIFRDVFLTSQPLVHISDYTVVTDLDSSYTNATMNLEVDIKNLSTTAHNGWSVNVAVMDEAGKNIIGNTSIPVTSVDSGKTASFKLSKAVTSPKLWSAENPNLYALVLTLVDGNGVAVETVSQQLGFREIEFTSTQVDSSYKVTTTQWKPITINGKRLLFKGVNRHDTDPFNGKAVTKEAMEEDIRVMQRNNINSIRTSHYSNDSYLYWICNKYGMYVMAETNLECHALMSNHDAKGLFYELAMDRTKTTFERLKNHPCNVSWSIGNEMVYTGDPNTSNGMFRDMIWFFKRNDPTRPVHSEGQGDKLGVDMASNMYPGSGSLWGRAGAGKMPYVMCEYDHAMGNSVGALKEYWDPIRSADNMLGGFIWDWCDQSRAVSLTTLNPSYGITDSVGNTGTCYGTDASWNNNAGTGSLNGGKSFSGYATLKDNAKFNAALSGTGKAFTFEVMVKPASTATNSVLLSKGDKQVALKTRSSGSGLEFFVYEGTSWKSVSCDFPSNWVGQWHQVVGVYNKGAISIYVDGNLMKSGSVADGIAAGTQPIGVGFDAENGRTVSGEISIARIYTRALSKAEIDGQRSATPAISSSDSSVLVWMDYSKNRPSADSGLWDYYAQSYAHKNLYADESKGHYFAYGGDWGDNPNDNSFCQNGLVSPDRTEQPEIAEVKFQYQNFWFSGDAEMISNRQVSVYNENNFKNLNEYTVKYELLRNGIVVDEGTASNTNVAPLSKGTISVPYEMPGVIKAGDEFYLNVSVLVKNGTDLLPAGTEISYGQFEVPAAARKVTPSISKDAVSVTESTSGFDVKGEDFSFTINKATGTMKSYTYKGEVLISEGPAPNFWRGYVENDNNAGKQKLFDTNWQHAANNIKVDSIKTSKNADGQNVITVNMNFPNAGGTKETIVYTINGSGEVTVKMTVDATATSMGSFLRVGSMMTLPAGFEKLSWYGNGPVETFNDRKTNGRQGVWESTVSEMFFPYMKADDCGNLTDVKWIAVQSSKHTNGLLVAATNPLEASALHFKPNDLHAAKHPYELSPRKETILSIDYGSMGTGSATCGQGTLSQYCLSSKKVYDWEFTIIPVSGTASGESLAESSKPYRSINSVIQDQSKNQIVIPVGSSASLKDKNGSTVLTGSVSVPSGNSLGEALQGKNSFTVEVNVTPTGNPEFNMFAGKGDNAFALRTRPGILDFHVYAGGSWRSISYNMPDDMAGSWVGRQHQIAGIYDASANTIRLYCDGKMLTEKATGTTEGVASSKYNFTIGACPDTGRSSQAEFSSVRVYNKALTATELAAQNTSSPKYAANNDAVELWVDFSADGPVYGDINADGTVDVKDVVLLQKYLLTLESFDKAQFAAADLNNDGKVNVFDMVFLKRILLGVL